MNKKRFVLILSIFLLFIPLAFAQIPLTEEDLCSVFDFTPENCIQAFLEYTVEDFCFSITELEMAEVTYDPATATCYLMEDFTSSSSTASPATASPAASSTNTTTQATTNVNLNEVKAGINDLNLRLVNLEQQLIDLQANLNTVSQQVTGVNTNFQSLNQQLNTQLNTVSTGLAGLQQDLNTTQTNLAAIDETSSTASFLSYFLLIILIAAAAYGTYYFINRNKIPKSNSSQGNMVNYFSRHLKKGRSHQEIRKNLQQAGWSPSMIDWAHQKAQQSPQTNRNKTIAIIVSSFVLIIIVVLFLGGNIGKAIYFNPDHTIEMVCESGKILRPDGFSCCTDTNANNLCDIDEVYDQQRTTTEKEICLDNRDCVVGKYCLDQKCAFLQELNSPNCPQPACRIISATLSTSDGETYTSLIGNGGYTAAGALDWTLLESPLFCNPQEVVVPIEIVKKRSSLGAQNKPIIKIISKKAITLRKGQTSPTLKHIAAPRLSFTLTLDDVNVRCD